ncbi:MAG: hypothetical protein DI538_01640 [Azospira oryzae]|nr:MAG: hypothetical protein DI538_01640 [Azospira oryzae]
MEEVKKPTTREVGIRFGLISAAITIVLFLIPALIGQNPFKGVWNWVGTGVSIGLIIFAHKKFKDDGDGYMSFGQGVGIVFWMGLISTIIGGIFTFVYINFVDTAPFDLMLEQNLEEMEKAGSPEQAIEMAQEWTRKLFWPIYFFFGVVGSVVVGLIVSIFTKKNNPEAEI